MKHRVVLDGAKPQIFLRKKKPNGRSDEK